MNEFEYFADRFTEEAADRMWWRFRVGSERGQVYNRDGLFWATAESYRWEMGSYTPVPVQNVPNEVKNAPEYGPGPKDRS